MTKIKNVLNQSGLESKSILMTNIPLDIVIPVRHS